MINDVKRIPMFQGAPEGFLEWISDETTSMVSLTLEPGESLFQQGDSPEYVYYLLDGELEITRTENGSEETVSRIASSGLAGRISIAPPSPCTCSARATRTARVLGIPTESMKRVFRSQIEIVTRQREKMSALNNLSAALAHHLNNPSAASRRAAEQLGETVQRLSTLTVKLHRHNLSFEHWSYLEALQQSLWTGALEEQSSVTPFEQSVREDAVEGWLESHQVPDTWDLAPFLVWGEFDVTRLDAIANALPNDALADAVAWVAGVLVVGELVQVLDRTTGSISSLVEAIKAYTHMDKAAVDRVDVHVGLESTLTILARKMGGMRVERAFDRELPEILAAVSELNQVWTNLIENAIDATSGHGTLRLRTYRKDDQIVVEIGDDGDGISESIRQRIYEPFFTTKPQGEGLGLGLNIAWRIVTQVFNGELDVVSHPGDTRFRVVLPIDADEAAMQAATQGNGA